MDTSLRSVDRAADGRARIYAQELRALVTAAAAFGDGAVPIAALEPLIARMLDEVPAPASLDAWRIKKEDGQ